MLSRSGSKSVADANVVNEMKQKGAQVVLARGYLRASAYGRYTAPNPSDKSCS